jgi:serine/threonine protein kinase
MGELGRGAMGIVYKARDTVLGRMVALKKLPDGMRDNDLAVKFFLREARSAAALNHPNIVTVFDAGQEGDSYFITMECLEGTPLDAVLKRAGKLSARDTAIVGMQAATGLAYAHSNSIIHRDIKASNLFYTRERAVKIMDFGLAKAVEEVRKQATAIAGTPYYMPPEQAIGGVVDHRSDLYALGVTLFQLCTGQVPFPDGDVTYHHAHTPPPDPRELVPEIPAQLAELILQLLAKRPEDRVQSAEEVARALREVAAGSTPART